MFNYAKVVAFIFDLCGNEFTTQLLLLALMYIPVFKKRKLFYVKYPACFAVIMGLQTLKRFGYFPVPEPVNYLLVFIMLSATIYISFKTNIMQALFTGVCIYGGQHIISNFSYALTFLIMHIAQDGNLYMYYYVIMPIFLAGGLAATYFLPVRILRKNENLKFNNAIISYFAVAFIVVASTLTHYARNAIFW